jgi:hypothetical protein
MRNLLRRPPGVPVLLVAAVALTLGGCRAANDVDRPRAACLGDATSSVRPPSASMRSEGGTEAEPATVLDHLSRSRIDVLETVTSYRQLDQRVQKRASFRLRGTGLRVEVFSDGPVEVVPREFDRLIELLLTRSGSVADRALARLLDCYEANIIDGNGLAGGHLRLFVPSDPRTCLRDLRLWTPPAGEADRCTSTGVALPALDVRIRALGLELGRAAMPATVVVAPGVDPDEDPSRHVTYTLVHELVHFLDNAMSSPPSLDDTAGMREYERRAYRVEELITEADQTGRLRLPRPIRYP